MADRPLYRYDEIEWHSPTSPDSAPASAEEVGRKFLAQGDEGFFAQMVRIPPGMTAPPHSHDHAEIFMVLEGTCRFGDAEMDRFDMTVVAADCVYGFTAGPDGVVFLVVRTGQARASLVS